MKASTITAILGLGLSVSAAPSIHKRLNRPEPTSPAVAVSNVTADAPLVQIWVDGPTANSTDKTLVELFIGGPFISKENTTSSDLTDVAISVLELAQQVGSSAGTYKHKRTGNDTPAPQVSVWVEGVQPTSGDRTTIDIFIEGPFVDPTNLKAGDVRDIAIGLLERANSVDNGDAPKPGPYVPGSGMSV